MRKGDAHKTDYRGVSNFVAELKKCKNPDEEQQRIDEELAKIRKCFSKTHVTPYNKKKYMWKIMYMYMLGYDVDFGHMQCVDLINSNSYSEKNVGYIGVSLLLIEHTDLLRLCIQSVKNDLGSRDEIHQCLALTCIANVGGAEFAESLTTNVLGLVTANVSRNFVRKKAALAMLRLIRQENENVPGQSDADKILGLLEHRNAGVVQCVMSLLLGLATYDPDSYKKGVPRVISLLKQFVMDRECNKDYIYYRTCCPWLQVKLLRFLQYFPPVESNSQKERLKDVLEYILTKTEVTQSVNKNNADHAILFEAVNVVIHLNIWGVNVLHKKTAELLARFISVKEPNIRYLGLEMMSRLAKIPETHSMIKMHLKTIQYSLEDLDVSIRRRALDLLYSIADEENIKEIVDHFLRYLENAEYGLREELVVKIAILAEKYASDLKWYVTVVLDLVQLADDFISDDVWHRIIHIVTNNEQLQAFAVSEAFTRLSKPPVSITMVKVAGYMLGEFGHLMDIPCTKQFEEVHKHFPSCDPGAQAQLLSTYMKMANLYNELVPKVVPIFNRYLGYIDPELQQRAVEYKVMAQWNDQEFMSQIWEAMPDFPDHESELLKRIKKNEAVTADRHVWTRELHDDRRVNKKGPTRGGFTPGGEDEPSSSSSSSDSDDSSDDEESKEDPKARRGKGPPSKPAPVKQQPQFADFLTFGDPVPAATAPQSAATPASPPKAGDPQLLIRLCVTDDGQLYDDETIMLGVKTKCNRTEGLIKMKFFYSNKSNVDLTNVSLKVLSSEGLNIELSPSGSFGVGKGQQVPQFIKISSLKPFTSLPKVQVNGTMGSTPFTVDLELPVPFTKFISPYAMEAKDFTERWKQMRAEKQEVIDFGRPLESAVLKKILSEAMGYAFIEGIDPKPTNLVAVGVFYTSTGVHMPTMLRLEWTKEKFRLTVRSPHDDVSKATVGSFSRIFGPQN